MMSLDNAFDEDELRAWAERLRRQVPDLDLESLAFSCEPKVDGVAMSLTYERGVFVQAATRGDGVTGEDVTANVATVKDVPKELAEAGGPYPDLLEVRGEIYMPVAEFEAMNKRQAELGERLFVNRATPPPARCGRRIRRSRRSDRCTSGPMRSAWWTAPRPRRPSKTARAAGPAGRRAAAGAYGRRRRSPTRWRSWPGRASR